MNEAIARNYVEKRFQNASKKEKEKIIRDWTTKAGASEGIVTDFEKRICPVSGLRVLDVGSGNGDMSVAFAKYGARVEGVDVEEELVSIARSNAEASGSTAHFMLYDGMTLPFPKQYFDAAISVSVIEHVSDPINYLAEMLRVLKSGGRLYLAFPNRLYPKETHTGLWGLTYLPARLARFYVRAARRNPLEDNGLHFYTYWQVARMLRSCQSGGRMWQIEIEEGRSVSTFKRTVKRVLRSLGLPYQAFLPHVMLVVRAS